LQFGGIDDPDVGNESVNFHVWRPRAPRGSFKDVAFVMTFQELRLPEDKLREVLQGKWDDWDLPKEVEGAR
jgi:hypothetical protein